MRVVDALAELAATLARDPAEAARSAGEIAEHARSCGDLATVGRAGVIRGRAMLLLGEIALAERALHEAVATADAAAEPTIAAEGHLALAAVRSAAGRHDDAFRSLDEVERIGPPALAERAALQRGVVCRDARRYDEALALFRAAIDRLRASGSDLDVARVLANCGGILTHQGRIDDAISDLTESIDLLRRGGHEFVALQVVHDLACAEAYRGDLAAALSLLDEAADGMHRLGHDASFPLLTRAEALLRAGLTTDALAAASDAARRLGAEGHAYAALALLTAAEAARLDGDAAESLALAEQAIAQFGAGGSTGWEGTARLEAIRARLELGATIGPDELDQLDAVVAGATEAGDHHTLVGAGALRASIAARLGEGEAAASYLADAAEQAGRGGLTQLTAAVAVAEADVALSGGDLAGARRAAHRAHRAVSALKQMYGAGESNPALGTEGRATVAVMLRIAAAERTATRRLDWTERTRALAAMPVTAAERVPQFAALRAVAAELRHAARTGQPTDALRQQQAAIEREIRARLLRARSDGTDIGTDAGPRSRLHRVVGDRALVSIAFAPGRAIAVVVDRRGARSVDLAPPAVLADAAARSAGALRGLSVASSPAIAQARRSAFTAAVDRIDELVLQPLRLRTDDVVLVVPPELTAVPWAATATLRPCRFTLAPSATWWSDATSARPAAPTSTGAAFAVAGPRLEHADAEATAVAACHPGATLLRGADATVDATVRAFATHDIAHVVAHGRFRHDNALWSTIELADGPMPVYELQHLTSAPRTIVVATCESAIGAGRGGIELQGLAASLLALGARTVVAAVGPLPDDATTVDTMVALHRDLRAGVGPAESLRVARSDAACGEVDPTAAALITIGVGA